MPQEDSKKIKYTLITLKFLEKILNCQIKVSGTENISKNPKLFIANHFTRSETFILPYIIYKQKHKKVKCLAHPSLFKGFIGELLYNVGAIPTDIKNRNEIIISDLEQNKANWIIYPEGEMVKNKKITIKRNQIFIDSDKLMKTGSAVFALQAQLNRMSDQNSIKIVPVHISYYPIRPKDNNIKRLIQKFIGKLPKFFEKELELEGNILLNSKIHINFGKEIDVKNYINSYKYKFFFNKSSENIIKKLRNGLTYEAMTKVYENIEINIDHLFAAIVFLSKEDVIEINEIKKIIFLIIAQIRKQNYQIEESLQLEKAIDLLLDIDFLPFENIKNFAIEQKLISQKSQKILIHRQRLLKEFRYSEIANKNILQILANEIFIVPNIKKIITKNIKKNRNKISYDIFKYLYDFDLDLFHQQYQKFYQKLASKPQEIGSPLFIHKKNHDNVVILCHGYLAAPKEMEVLAHNIHQNGFDTYSIRLEGHGTSPENLKCVSWQDWLFSFSRAYGALKNQYKKVFIVGFSTGGLLSLLAGSNIAQNSNGIICINGALKLQDIRFRFASPVKYWNELMNFFKINKAKLEFIENKPENPEINYHINYLHSVTELKKLMTEVSKNLKNLKIPTMIIHSDNDPIVNPESGKIIYNNIVSKRKKLEFIKSNNHVITNQKELIDKVIFYLSDL